MRPDGPPRSGRTSAPSRRALLRALGAAGAALLGARPRTARADEVAVPIALQAQLLVKVAEYDRNLRARAGDRVHVLLIASAADPSSMPAVLRMQQALRDLQAIAGLPHETTVMTFGGAVTLAEAVRARRASIVYLGPGLRAEVAAIRDALASENVLTASAVADYVERGVVLGFDLVSGKPKVLVHLTQARRQKVALGAEVLKLMRIYE